MKPIEEIEVGDEVLAYDEETGEQAYKPVTRLFRNETEEWYHIRVNGEEIVCTGGHPFYVLNAEEDRKVVEFDGVKASGTGTWICARELKVSDQVFLSDGSCAIIEEIQVEKLSAPETTYNFEVADFHTYYVSESNVLVHNMCNKQANNGSGDIQTGGAKNYSIHESQNAAFRAAKRYAGIPMSEQPIKVIQSVDRMGRAIPGRTYIFQNGTRIMQHSAGHMFENGIKMTKHFNILGSTMHFFY